MFRSALISFGLAAVAALFAVSPSQAGTVSFNFAGTPSAGSLPGYSQTWTAGSFHIQTSVNDGWFSTDMVDQVSGLGLGICQQDTDRHGRPDGQCVTDRHNNVIDPGIDGFESLEINLGTHPGWTLDDLLLEVSAGEHYEVFACTDREDCWDPTEIAHGSGPSCGRHDSDCLDLVTLNLTADNRDEYLYVYDDNDGGTLLVNGVTGVTVPEPMSLSLMAAGLLGFGALRRRRREA